MKMNSPEVVQKPVRVDVADRRGGERAADAGENAAITYFTCTAWRAEPPMYSTRISFSRRRRDRPSVLSKKIAHRQRGDRRDADRQQVERADPVAGGCRTASRAGC